MKERPMNIFRKSDTGLAYLKNKNVETVFLFYYDGKLVAVDL